MLALLHHWSNPALGREGPGPKKFRGHIDDTCIVLIYIYKYNYNDRKMSKSKLII